MYKVVKINESLATRILELENEITGKKELCFDDSALVSRNNFDFMKESESYDCSIKLFGEIADKRNQEAILCNIVSREKIGNKNFFKVLASGEIYYVPQSKVPNSGNDAFLFAYTRKDLIKVNEVIHESLLSE